MKRILSWLLFILIIVLSLSYGVRVFRQKIDSALSTQPAARIAPSPTPTGPAASHIDETLFVPYWSVTEKMSGIAEQQVIYFGIKATASGIDTGDDGYKKLGLFSKSTELKHSLLTVRMIDSTSNFAILKDKTAQQRVIKEAIGIAKDYGFEGILLNLEVSALPFTSLVDQITVFNTTFSEAAHSVNLEYSITAYGDTFYRLRPFDLQKLADKSDRIYIMAYDFSKAKGNPGPNFPLGGSSTYGYDYEHMVNNFADVMPLKKITVVFGMYGYDWAVDDNDKATEMAEAISLKDIKATILDSCKHSQCEWEREGLSAETKATYQDSDAKKHLVWFEDETSVKRKQEFLKNHGIGSYAYWAYSYF